MVVITSLLPRQALKAPTKLPQKPPAKAPTRKHSGTKAIRGKSGLAKANQTEVIHPNKY